MSEEQPTWAEERSRKQDVFNRMLTDQTAMEAINAEPELRNVIGEAFAQKPSPQYNRVKWYYQLKERVSQFVGIYARNPKLGDSRHYDAVLYYTELLLPEDDLDLGLDGEDMEPAWVE